MISLLDGSVEALDIINKNQFVIDFVIFGGDQETSCQIYCLGASIQLLDLLVDPIVHKEAIHELNGDVGRSVSLLELLRHPHYSADEVVSTFQILKTDFMLFLGHFSVFQELSTI